MYFLQSTIHVLFFSTMATIPSRGIYPEYRRYLFTSVTRPIKCVCGYRSTSASSYQWVSCVDLARSFLRHFFQTVYHTYRGVGRRDGREISALHRLTRNTQIGFSSSCDRFGRQTLEFHARRTLCLTAEVMRLHAVALLAVWCRVTWAEVLTRCTDLSVVSVD